MSAKCLRLHKFESSGLITIAKSSDLTKEDEISKLNEYLELSKVRSPHEVAPNFSNSDNLTKLSGV